MSCTHRYQSLRRLPLDRRYTLRQPLVGWRRCAKNMHDPKGLLETRSASPRAPASIAAAVSLEGILSEASSASLQKRRTSKKPNAKNIEDLCSYRQNENVPPGFKQYKIQGNASNLVQSHFGSPPLKELEGGIAPLVPWGFDPACWGLIQLPPSPPPSWSFDPSRDETRVPGIVPRLPGTPLLENA